MLVWLLSGAVATLASEDWRSLLANADAHRDIYIKPMAGESNVISGLISGVALAMLTGRTPVVPWRGLFESDRYGLEPPPGIVRKDAKGKHEFPSECTLNLDHGKMNHRCWSEMFQLYDESIASQNDSAFRYLMPRCSTVYVESNQLFLPMLLPMKIHGRTLLSWLSPHGDPEPAAVLVSEFIRPPPSLAYLVEEFHRSLTPVSQTRGQGVRLLTVQLRLAILGYREYPNAIKDHGGSKQKGIDQVNERFAACAAMWANHAKATHIYLASDDFNTEKGEIERRMRQHLQDSESTQFLSLSNMTSYAARVGNASTKMAVLNEKGDFNLPSLAESLMLARGRVCIRTPRSTYSKISTVWWNGQFCDTIVEAPECTATYRRLQTVTPSTESIPKGSDEALENRMESGEISDHEPSMLPNIANASTRLPHAMHGLVTDSFGCNGIGCGQSRQNIPRSTHPCKAKEHCCFSTQSTGPPKHTLKQRLRSSTPHQ